MVFRVTRGTTYLTIENIDNETDNEGNPEEIRNPNTGKILKKAVFFIIYAGGKKDVLLKKLNSICKTFDAT